ncbi:MAG: OB-fold domain-containing protein [Acidobacteria bacterium]|nr:OB-fold domain-containing protein [Acidobacteriota bacterium]
MNKTKARVAAVEGLFTLDENEPHLIGGKVIDRESYCFPKDLGGTDPASDGEVEEVLLSRHGTIWSFSDSQYPPPPPYPVTEPYQAVTIAAVELDKEKMVVLGQVADGFSASDLNVGMEVELVLGTLYEDDENVYLVWKWKPVTPKNEV